MSSYSANGANSLAASALSGAEISRQLGGDGSVSADGWSRCPCPAHHGTRASLSLELTAPDRLIVRCWSCDCSLAVVLMAIDARLGTSFSYRLDAAADFTDPPVAAGTGKPAEAR